MDVLQKLLAGLDQIKAALLGLDQGAFIASLPFVTIEDEEVSESLPRKMTAVYFLTHDSEGLLYVGKTHELRKRWLNAYWSHNHCGHQCMPHALHLKDVRLSWWQLPKELIEIVESSLIRLWTPKWNRENQGLPKLPDNEVEDTELRDAMRRL